MTQIREEVIAEDIEATLSYTLPRSPTPRSNRSFLHWVKYWAPDRSSVPPCRGKVWRLKWELFRPFLKTDFLTYSKIFSGPPIRTFQNCHSTKAQDSGRLAGWLCLIGYFCSLHSPSNSDWDVSSLSPDLPAISFVVLSRLSRRSIWY